MQRHHGGLKSRYYSLRIENRKTKLDPKQICDNELIGNLKRLCRIQAKRQGF